MMLRPIHMLLFVLALAAAGCDESEPAEDFVARVGTNYLTHAELDDALQNVATAQDSAEASQQIIEQWITNQLLYQEAQRRGLRDEPDVQQLLRENERSVLISALVSSMHDEENTEPTMDELRNYYNRHREQLQLREPFARVRYLSTRSADSAARARELLQEAVVAGEADSVWTHLAERFARDPAESRDLAEHFYPQSRLFRARPALRSTLENISVEQIAPLIRTDSLVHVLQLAGRAPSGTIPEFSWIEDQLRQRLTIQARKQHYARQVQRLRNEALAREDLEVH